MKAKKKRKGKTDGDRQSKDGVLQRLGTSSMVYPSMYSMADIGIVPHMSYIPLSVLPETNLPGFARSFLSLGFMWMTSESGNMIDWEKELPEVEWPDDGEVL